MDKGKFVTGESLGIEIATVALTVSFKYLFSCFKMKLKYLKINCFSSFLCSNRYHRECGNVSVPVIKNCQLEMTEISLYKCISIN